MAFGLEFVEKFPHVIKTKGYLLPYSYMYSVK